MGKYTIELNYIARIVRTVDATDEGDALEKARNLAEDADMNEFSLCEEQTSNILSNY